MAIHSYVKPLYISVLAWASVTLYNSNDEIESSSFVASIRFCLNLYIINGKSGSLELNLFHGQKYYELILNSLKPSLFRFFEVYYKNFSLNNDMSKLRCESLWRFDIDAAPVWVHLIENNFDLFHTAWNSKIIPWKTK